MWNDLRYALRALLKQPAFSAIVVLTLALGIGANTAVFSVFDAVLLRPLPYDQPDRLMMVWSKDRADLNPVSFPDFQDIERQNTVFTATAVLSYNRFNVNGKQGPDLIRGAFVSGRFFDVLGVKPLLGRTLGPADEHERVTVISYELWQRYFGGASDVVGQSIRLNDEPHTVVGVMPRGFQAPTSDIELWPSMAGIYGLASASAKTTLGDWINDRNLRGYRMIARLKPGVTREQAEGQLNGLAARLAAAYPASNKDLGIELQPLREWLSGDMRPVLLVLLGAVGFVLLIACANVANLLLSRASLREREMAIRSALGAGRARLAGQLLAESAVLALAGGALGVLLGAWALDALLALGPADLLPFGAPHMDWRVLLFSLGAALATAMVFGFVPAIQISRPQLLPALQTSGKGAGTGEHGRATRNVFMVAQVALALTLLVGAGLMIESFRHLLELNPGFRAANVLTLRSGVLPHYVTDPGRQAAFVRRVEADLAALPGVRAVGISSSLPPQYVQRGTNVEIEGRPVEDPAHPLTALYVPVTHDYFKALEIPLRSGRFFTAADGDSAPQVCIVSADLVKDYFAGQDPLGRKIRVGATGAEGVWATIVGVVGEVKFQGLEADTVRTVYVPYDQHPFPGLYMAVKTAGDPLALADTVRRTIWAVDPDVAVTRMLSMDQLLAEAGAQRRWNTALIGGFAGLAALLAALGIYGVLSYAVSQRRQEIGIRMALGAQPGDVLRMVVGQGVMLAMAGIAIGLAAALLLGRFLAKLLFGVGATDPPTLAAVCLAMVALALLACWIPARRAARVDPMVALRYE